MCRVQEGYCPNAPGAGGAATGHLVVCSLRRCEVTWSRSPVRVEEPIGAHSGAYGGRGLASLRRSGLRCVKALIGTIEALKTAIEAQYLVDSCR